MFYYLEGTVALIEKELAVIDCGGVGYACHTSQNTCASIRMGEKTRLYTYLSIRENACDLYGFAQQEELNCFKLLLGVSGVGPKAALAILGIAPPSQLALSIITEDAKFLTQAPGIGKKIAQRICLELKDKLAKEQGSLADRRRLGDDAESCGGRRGRCSQRGGFRAGCAGLFAGRSAAGDGRHSDRRRCDFRTTHSYLPEKIGGTVIEERFYEH